ncbi:MAG TPA: IclR family transcriptional regulator C-terminal domain-containing protein, partial [Candidatus Angelobacter sp.]|nr:IclR family transcriptional regulator C-terminal domain-containing protein [Candidatus Angelobacter sp.]
LWKMILDTREKGFAFSDSELEEGTAAYAVPIFDSGDAIAASLSLAGFSTTLQNAGENDFVIPMWRMAAKISKLLGYKPSYPYLRELHLMEESYE